MTGQDMEIADDLRLLLADKVGQERFDLWFGNTTLLELQGDVLSIHLPDQFSLDWVRKNFRRQIEDACEELTGTAPALEFRIDSKLKRRRNVELSKVTSSNLRDSSVRDVVSRSESPSPERTRSRGRQFSKLDQFVVSDQCRVAYTAATMVTRQPGAINPLFIYGPHGVGKTHLLEGIWSWARRSSSMRRVIYLSAEQFTSYFLAALHGSGLPSFRTKYRDADLLIIDDVQFFARKQATIIELLHTTDSLLREGRQLAFAADRSPAELNDLGPELMGRLVGGLVCGMDYPNRDERVELASLLARQCEAKLPRSVIEFLADHLSGDARMIRGAIHRLVATGSAMQQEITLALAQNAMADVFASIHRVVDLGSIEHAVCETFGLDKHTLHSNCKARSVHHPRMLAMWLARKHTRAALSEISHHFGRRSHSTVITAQKRIDRWRADGQSLQVADMTWSVDEAIRKVESRLSAG